MICGKCGRDITPYDAVHICLFGFAPVVVIGGNQQSKEKPMQEGWLCPKCHVVNAPWLPQCTCHTATTSYTIPASELSTPKKDKRNA